MSNLLRKDQCPHCAANGNDNSRDNLAIYDNGSYCFACGYAETEYDKKFHTGNIVDLETRGLTKESLGKYNVQVLRYTGFLGKAGTVTDKVCVAFNWFKNGRVEKQKVRDLQDRSNCIQLGNTKSTALFGMHAFTPSKKIPVVVTEGEFDAVSVYQGMNYPSVSVGGTQNAVKALSNNLEWLSGWAYVVLCFDSDDAGREAVDKCISLFEVGTCRVAHLPLKDANEMILAHREDELKRAIWNAEIIKPSTIVSINDLRDRVLHKPQYGTPWHYEMMNKVTYGLMPGNLYAVAAAEGIGKTEFIKELIFHLLDTKLKVGIFSFEQDAESTVQRLIGSKLNKRLHLPSEQWWNEDTIIREMDALEDNLFLYDNRGSLSLENVLLNIRYLVKCYGIKFVVIDNLTAMCANPVIDGKIVNDIVYMGHVANQLHSLVKELKVSMCIVAHLNNDTISKHTYISKKEVETDDYINTGTEDFSKKLEEAGLTWDTGRMPQITNIYGSGVLRKLADYVIVLARNKIADDAEIRRTTRVKFLKCRLDSQYEGTTFNLYYNYETGRLEETPGFIGSDNDVI